MVSVSAQLPVLCTNITSAPTLSLPELGAHALADVEWWWVMGVVETISEPKREFGIDFLVSRADQNCIDLQTSGWGAKFGISDPQYNYLTRGYHTQMPNEVSATQNDIRPFHIQSQNFSLAEIGRNIYQAKAVYNDIFTGVPAAMDFVFADVPNRQIKASLDGTGYFCCPNLIQTTAWSTCTVQLDSSLFYGIGSLTVGPSTHQVAGRFYISHQWVATPPPILVGASHWAWFYFQLDNDWTGELTQFFVPALGQGTGSIIRPRRHASNSSSELDRVEQLHFMQAQVGYSIQPTAFWTSPYTGVTYGTKHTITIPHLKVVLHFEVMVQDADYFGFYEAPSKITGEVDGKAVKGVGSTEYA